MKTENTTKLTTAAIELVEDATRQFIADVYEDDYAGFAADTAEKHAETAARRAEDIAQEVAAWVAAGFDGGCWDEDEAETNAQEAETAANKAEANAQEAEDALISAEQTAEWFKELTGEDITDQVEPVKENAQRARNAARKARNSATTARNLVDMITAENQRRNAQTNG